MEKEATKDKILKKHFNKTRNSLLELSNHFDILKDGTTKGNAREGLIHEFLQKNLPSIVDYLTGEIIDTEDLRSGQIDIILQSISDPRMKLYKDYHIALCDAVLAVIEVKSTLTTGDPQKGNSFNDAMNTFKKVKLLNRKVKIKSITPEISADKETIPCILFSYKGPTYETLSNTIKEYVTFCKYDKEECNKFLPEIIVILDKGYYVYKEDGWIFKRDLKYDVGVLMPNLKEEETLIGVFVYLCNIIQSWNQNRRFSNYIEYLK